MNVLGLIPARGGSKRLPRKNLQLLGPQPLLVWTLAAAHYSDYLDRFVVSSEDEEIIEVARDHAVEVLERPAQYATDEATSYHVIKHALSGVLGEPFDVLCLLQPTSPFRSPNDIDGCIELYHQTGAPAAVSHEKGKPVPNGAVYVGNVGWLMDGGSFDSPGLAIYEMPSDRSLDVDTENDLEEAREMLKRWPKKT